MNFFCTKFSSRRNTALALCLLATITLPAQYPVSRSSEKKPAPPTIRAVGVIEWIGPEGKPTASRLIPISIFVNNHFQDAGLYLARPEPMALDSGTRYEIQQSGNPKGYFDVSSAGRVPADKYDTLWVGLGVWKPLEPVRPSRNSRNAKNNFPKPVVDIDDGQPHLLRRPGSESTGPDNSSSNKSSTSGSNSSGSNTSNSSGPVLKRRDDSGTTANSGTIDNSGDGNPPDADDPDRPHLTYKPATPPPAINDNGTGDAPASGAETNLAKLGDDPNRPMLHRGKPTSGPNAGPDSQLQGEPIQMQQRVAVSDAANRDPHSFVYNWADAKTLTALQSKLESIAQKDIAAMVPPQPAVQPVAAPAITHAHKAPTPPPAPNNTIVLTDEKLSSFELTYDAGATLVYSAHTPGEGAQRRYVTLIAQVDIYGEPTVLFSSTTDEAHLDQNPQMKLVDVVDADGDNRGELLFELREDNQRQFALYRVYHGAATQVFLTGSMP